MEIPELTTAQLGAGDEVIVPALGGEKAAETVRSLGGRVVVADIDPLSYCLDPASVQAVLSERTRGVVPLHLFGHPADMAGLMTVAGRHGVPVMAFGPQPGEDTSLEAARRRRHAAFLSERLTGVVVPQVRNGMTHTYAEYVVRVPGNGRPDRDAFMQALRARGVVCRVPVLAPVHRFPLFRSDAAMPVAEQVADECLALPVDAGLTQREIQRVVTACNALGGLLVEAAA